MSEPDGHVGMCCACACLHCQAGVKLPGRGSSWQTAAWCKPLESSLGEGGSGQVGHAGRRDILPNSVAHARHRRGCTCSSVCQSHRMPWWWTWYMQRCVHGTCRLAVLPHLPPSVEASGDLQPECSRTPSPVDGPLAQLPKQQGPSCQRAYRVYIKCSSSY